MKTNERKRAAGATGVETTRETGTRTVRARVRRWSGIASRDLSRCDYSRVVDSAATHQQQQHFFFPFYPQFVDDGMFQNRRHLRDFNFNETGPKATVSVRVMRRAYLWRRLLLGDGLALGGLLLLGVSHLFVRDGSTLRRALNEVMKFSAAAHRRKEY